MTSRNTMRPDDMFKDPERRSTASPAGAVLRQAIGELRAFAQHLHREGKSITASQLDEVLDLALLACQRGAALGRILHEGWNMDAEDVHAQVRAALVEPSSPCPHQEMLVATHETLQALSHFERDFPRAFDGSQSAAELRAAITSHSEQLVENLRALSHRLAGAIEDRPPLPRPHEKALQDAYRAIQDVQEAARTGSWSPGLLRNLTLVAQHLRPLVKQPDSKPPQLSDGTVEHPRRIPEETRANIVFCRDLPKSDWPIMHVVLSVASYHDGLPSTWVIAEWDGRWGRFQEERFVNDFGVAIGELFGRLNRFVTRTADNGFRE